MSLKVGSNLVGALVVVSLGFITVLLPLSAQAPPGQRQIVGQRILLKPGGFRPSAVTVRQGKVLLFVSNATGIRPVRFLLDRVTGSRLYDISIPVNRLGWREIVDFVPGTYLLTEASHPNWTCTITVIPR